MKVSPRIDATPAKISVDDQSVKPKSIEKRQDKKEKKKRKEKKAKKQPRVELVTESRIDDSMLQDSITMPDQNVMLDELHQKQKSALSRDISNLNPF